MSDLYLLQGSGQDEPNENQVYLEQQSLTKSLASAVPEAPTKLLPTRAEVAPEAEPSVLSAPKNPSGNQTNGHEFFYKTSEEVLDQMSGRGSPIQNFSSQGTRVREPSARKSPVQEYHLQKPRLKQSLSQQSQVKYTSNPENPGQQCPTQKPSTQEPVRQLPFKEKQLLLLGYQDTDSCVSVSPSPDPDSRKKTFDFSMIDTEVNGSNLSAALQMEQEFLDFMLSLPQIQKEAKAKEQQQQQKLQQQQLHQKKQLQQKQQQLQQQQQQLQQQQRQLQQQLQQQHQQQQLQQQTQQQKTSHARSNHKSSAQPRERPKSEKRSIENASRAGLDHLDNLCRMMDQLGELKEQNTRLQRRVQYLEELKALQEIHQDVQNSIAERKTALSLGSVSLSDSDLRLEDNKLYAYLLDSEESLDQSLSSAVAKTKGKKGRCKENCRFRSHSIAVEEHGNFLAPPSRKHINNASSNNNNNNISNDNAHRKSSRWSRVKGVLKMDHPTEILNAPVTVSCSKNFSCPSFSLSCPGKVTPSLLPVLAPNGIEIPYSIVHPPSPSSSDSSNPSQVLTEESILNLYRVAIPAIESKDLKPKLFFKLKSQLF